MRALMFSPLPIVPEIDPTEYLIQTVGQVALDFAQAITEAHSVSRALQLSQRLEVCLQFLQQAQLDALAKADSF